MSYSEDDLIPISALQHYAFCPRQCALIHVARLWGENRLTAEGRVLHERVHERGSESRGDVRREFGLRLQSLRVGLVGQADVVEFRRENGDWTPFPVEYKRGKPKPDHCDAVQLCAQAICLEEMTGKEVPEGALFYGKTRRRQDVRFGEELRDETKRIACNVRSIVERQEVPAGEEEKRCRSCSLVDLCRPGMTVEAGRVERYLTTQMQAAAREQA